MRVTVFDGENVVGRADLAASDPSMGVASGVFHPGSAYSRAEHANLVDGEFVGDKSAELRVISEDHEQITCGAIVIGDWPTLKEIHLDLLAITSPDYAGLKLPEDGLSEEGKR